MRPATALLTCLWGAFGAPGAAAAPSTDHAPAANRRTVSHGLFLELEELSRLVGIAYCVGTTGIGKPFECLSHCSDFEGFELVETWDTGMLDSVSCGYIALAHSRPQRIVVAFRGSHSISDALYDLMTQPAEYAPFPTDDDVPGRNASRCPGDCKAHAGFLALWAGVRAQITPTLQRLVAEYPAYQLELAGHSLGGALAGLAALEYEARGWRPRTTTFGEPRFGNAALAAHVDRVFGAGDAARPEHSWRYRRVTHQGDPVPLLPLEKWGWRMHAGEIFIAKDGLPPELQDVWRCQGDADPQCIAGPNKTAAEAQAMALVAGVQEESSHRPPVLGVQREGGGGWLPGVPGLPAEWRLWEILFAHRQYFWRVGLCWDPQRIEYPRPTDMPGYEL